MSEQSIFNTSDNGRPVPVSQFEEFFLIFDLTEWDPFFINLEEPLSHDNLYRLSSFCFVLKRLP